MFRNSETGRMRRMFLTQLTLKKLERSEHPVARQQILTNLKKKPLICTLNQIKKNRLRPVRVKDKASLFLRTTVMKSLHCITMLRPHLSRMVTRILMMALEDPSLDPISKAMKA